MLGPKQVTGKAFGLVITTSDTEHFCELSVNGVDDYRHCDRSNDCDCSLLTEDLPCGGYHKLRATCRGERPVKLLIFTFDMAKNNRAMADKRSADVAVDGTVVHVNAISALCRFHTTMASVTLHIHLTVNSRVVWLHTFCTLALVLYACHLF